MARPMLALHVDARVFRLDLHVTTLHVLVGGAVAAAIVAAANLPKALPPPPPPAAGELTA